MTRRSVLSLEPSELAVGEEPTLTGPTADAARRRVGQHHELVRVAHRQRAHEHTVEQAEDGGVGANPEGEREHGHRREPRVGEENAQRVTQVLLHDVSMLPKGGGARSRNTAAQMAATAARRRCPARVAQLRGEGAGHLVAELVPERRRIAPKQHAIEIGAAHGIQLARDQAGGPRLTEDIGDTTRFGGRDRAAEGRDRVVAAPLVLALRIGALAQLLDQALLQHPPHGAVERAGAEAHLAVGALADVLHDRVAMPLRSARATRMGRPRWAAAGRNRRRQTGRIGGVMCRW